MITRRFPRQLAFACAFVCVLTIALTGASPTFWTVSSQADFLKGDVEDLSIDSDGRMFLGPAASVLGETSAPFLWSIVAGPDGSLWAGSGNEGKVLKIAKDGKVTTFFDAAELEVHAIAPAPQGGLYVATSPTGRSIRSQPTARRRRCSIPKTKHLGLASIRPARSTRPPATRASSTRSRRRQGHRFYKTSATNVVSLAVTKSASSSPEPNRPARVPNRRDRQGVRAARFPLSRDPRAPDRGRRHHLRGGRERDPPRQRSPVGAADRRGRSVVPSVSTEITGMTVVEGGISSSTPPPAARLAGRPRRDLPIKTDGLWDTIWETGEDAPHDIVVEDGGSLLVGTGTDGKIFRLSGNPARATLLARAAARQVTALLREPSGRIVGATSNPGKVFALSSSPARSGTYESGRPRRGNRRQLGCDSVAFTGRPGQVQIVTRSGNTQRRTKRGALVEAYTNAEGEPIGSPNAPYLQWKATISAETGEGPVLTRSRPPICRGISGPR